MTAGPADAARRHGLLRALAVVLGAVVGLNLVLALIDSARPEPSGPASSSYATAPAGLAAYADLLGRSGYRIRRIRDRIGDRTLDPRATVVVLDPDAVSPDEANAIRRFLDRGGRLIAGGERPQSWLERVLGAQPELGPGGEPVQRPLAPVPETAGVERVETAARARWDDAGPALPVLGGDEGASVLVAAVGRGRAVLLADPSPLQNRLLARADNAALGLALAGERSRPVHFAESVHGYGAGRGLAALPGRWQLALAGLALAGLVWALSRARRLGPPEQEDDEPPPPRSAYVDALAGALARSGDRRQAADPVRAAARAAIVRRAGLRRDAADDELAAAGGRIGLGEAELGALTGDLSDDDDVLAAGRALARLSRER